jgi:hypothetical protein
MNESISIDHEVTKPFYPLYKGQTSVGFNIMASAKSEVEYTDEDDVWKLGSITVDIPPFCGTASSENACNTTMAFGLTEIVVTVRVGESDTIKRTTIDFAK